MCQFNFKKLYIYEKVVYVDHKVIDQLSKLDFFLCGQGCDWKFILKENPPHIE